MTLIAGSYEKYIWGYKFKSQQTLTPLFSYPSHSAPIKTITAASTIAASGSADDSINLYDLSTASSLSSLLHHSGAVTSLSFFSSASIPLNLISGSDDGNICIFGVDPFVHLKTVAIHRKGVVDFAVHPTGRVGVSVGRDGVFALVNLVRGRRSFSCRMEREAGVVEYSLGDGGRFFMGVDETIRVHDSEDARVVCELKSAKRVLCLAPAENGLLLAGGEDHCVTAWDTNSGKVAYQFQNAHLSRVKGVVIFNKKNTAQGSEGSSYVASASSDGMIRVWDTRMASEDKPTPVAEANTNSRLTCLAVSTK